MGRNGSDGTCDVYIAAVGSKSCVNLSKYGRKGTLPVQVSNMLSDLDSGTLAPRIERELSAEWIHI